jgi:hypothetical protein
MPSSHLSMSSNSKAGSKAAGRLSKGGKKESLNTRKKYSYKQPGFLDVLAVGLLPRGKARKYAEKWKEEWKRERERRREARKAAEITKPLSPKASSSSSKSSSVKPAMPKVEGAQ